MPIFRPGLPLPQQVENLGPLAGLVGTWRGNGYNFILLPDFSSTPPSTGPAPFRVLANATDETLEFTSIGGAVPNRGSEVPGTNPVQGQNDINIFGVRYLQQISDRNTGEALHLEPGFWLNVPATQIPSAPASIVRQGSIPHGTSMIAQGTGFASPTGKPVFPVASTTPVKNPNVPPPLGAGYLAPITEFPLPAPFTDPTIRSNPNVILSETIAPVLADITKTEVLSISTATAGGVLNIPFLQNSTNNNAAIESFSAIFWIETVQPRGFPSYQILQYTQTIVLNFLGINWPHITVATLYLQ